MAVSSVKRRCREAQLMPTKLDCLGNYRVYSFRKGVGLNHTIYGTSIAVYGFAHKCLGNRTNPIFGLQGSNYNVEMCFPSWYDIFQVQNVNDGLHVVRWKLCVPWLHELMTPYFSTQGSEGLCWRCAFWMRCSSGYRRYRRTSSSAVFSRYSQILMMTLGPQPPLTRLVVHPLLEMFSWVLVGVSAIWATIKLL